MKILLCLGTAVMLIQCVATLPTSYQDEPNSVEILEKGISGIYNKTTERAVFEEVITSNSEEVKKITADHPQPTIPEYPVVTKKEPQREIDKLTIEELRIKCQQLSKILNLNKESEDKINSGSTSRPLNHKYPDKSPRPTYIASKPNSKPRYPTTRPNGFYITAQPVASKKPVPSSSIYSPTNPPIKYIRLEPVILQKTILGDGRTVFYWHRSLPTAVEYSNNYPQTSQEEPQTQSDYQLPNSYGVSPPVSYYIAPSNMYPSSNYYVPALQNVASDQFKNDEHTTESTTTSTTAENSYSYGLSNFIPFYGYHQDPTTTESSTISTTTTTQKPQDNILANDLLYAQQLKFVIPVPVEDGGSVRQPLPFDPYAYYPKPLQPNEVNIQVPYSPTFHMIKAVTIPKSEGKIDEVEIK